MIACFLSNISAKYYKNPSMLSRVIAKNVGDVFLRHSVEYGRLPTQPFVLSGSISINQSINQSWIYIAHTGKASNALVRY